MKTKINQEHRNKKKEMIAALEAEQKAVGNQKVRGTAHYEATSKKRKRSDNRGKKQNKIIPKKYPSSSSCIISVSFMSCFLTTMFL